MYHTEQQYLFWKIVHYLVVEKNYQIITFDEMKEEVWIENKNGLIRLKRQDVDWGNWIKSDLKLVHGNMERIRKTLLRRQLNAVNVYISTYIPVMDWNESGKQTSRTRHKKNNLYSMVIDYEHQSNGLNHFFETIKEEKFHIDRVVKRDIEQVSQLKREVVFNIKQKEEHERKLFTFGKPFFMYVFIAINLLIFGLLEINGGSTNTRTLIDFGAKYNPAMLSGDWWRFITPMFLHIGFLHLLMNSLALYYIGSAVERIYGRSRFFLIYIVSGIAGISVSFALNNHVSAGASGAIFGCFGALLYFGVNYRNLFLRTMGKNIIGVLVINLFIGLTIPMVDNGAHIGGLIGGFIVSAIVHLPRHRPIRRQLLAFVLLLFASAGILFYGFLVQKNHYDAMTSVQIAQQYIQEDQFVEAGNVLNEALPHINEPPAEFYFMLSYVDIKQNKLKEAEVSLLKAIQKRSNFHEAYFNLAIIYAEFGEREKAIQNVEIAMQLAPSEQQYRQFLNELNDNNK